MATLPMMQPQNPNQASGAALRPMSNIVTGGAIGATTPAATIPTTAVGSAGNTQTPFGTVNTGTSISSGITPTTGDNSFVGDFQDVYGSGVGTQLAGTLATLGTSTNAAVQATNASILQAAGDQYGNVLANEAASGISPDSSSHALAAGDFNAKVNQTIASTDANMQLSQLDTLISSLFTEGKAHGHDSSGWDTFSNIMGTVGSDVGSVVSAVTGIPGLNKIAPAIWGSGGGSNLPVDTSATEGLAMID